MSLFLADFVVKVGGEPGPDRMSVELFVLGVPIRHSDLYFMIKSHLNLVRSRIGLRRTVLRDQKTTPRLLR